MSDSVRRIVNAGLCTGCGACLGCDHLRLSPGPLGFDVPLPDESCTGCGACVRACPFDPLREDD